MLGPCRQSIISLPSFDFPDSREKRLKSKCHFSLKQKFMKAFFDEFEKKVKRLEDLHSQSFKDEAFTLCLVYIDRLASGHYGGDAGKNRENFCRALKELSGNHLFGMLHPRELSEQAQQHYPDALPVIASITNRQRYTLLDESTVAAAINLSALTPSKKQKLIDHIWRSSIASICYAEIRGPEVHGVGSGGLDFDKTIYGGKVGLRIDFELFYGALLKILEHIKNESAQSGHWFGNPNYRVAHP